VSDQQSANGTNSILPKYLICPNCGQYLALEEEQRKGKKFYCSGCRLIINMNKNAKNNFNFSTKLPQRLECPRCRDEVELEEYERISKRFICPWCNKRINLT